MTIRFTCDQCGSVLKIKDELAGTDGKCPKCKKRFVVPEAGAPEPPAAASSGVAQSSPDDIAAAALMDSPSEAAPPKPSTAKTTEKISSSDKSDKAAKGPGPKAPKKADDDDFDPVSFLMEGPAKKAPAFEPDEPAPRTPMAGGRTGGGGGGFSLDDDDEAPLDAPLPTKKWGARKDTTAAAADKSLGGSTSAAKDLLAKSMEESRVRAGEMPEEAPRFNFDFAGFFREFGVKGVGGVAGVLAAAVGVFWIMNSMVSSKLALPELGYVSGKITVGGKPQAGIKVNFSPKVREIEGIRDKNQRARDSFGVTDDQGNYTLYYTQDIPGVKVGQCRVTMEASDPKIPIPPKYLGTQDVTEEVLPGNNPPKNFEL